jgi:acyl-CoA synthetase (NDP forming)
MPPETNVVPRADLTRFLNPRSIAVIGASNDAYRIGGQTVKLLTEFGFKGNVYPVNPKYEAIAGLKCYPDITAVPKPCDVVLIALAGAQVPGVIEQCGKVGIPFAIVLSAGFGEVDDGKALQVKLKAAIKASGMRMVGPNCLGVANFSTGYRAGFGGTLQLPNLKAGPVAMITQSGGFGFGVVSSACYYGIGFNYLVSTGNEDDLSMLDWVEHVLEQPEVEIVTVFMEGTTEGRRLIKIGERALELGKPILVWKVGNTSAGRQAVTSHTARLTAGPELFKTVFRHGGFVEVRDIDDLVDVCKAFLGRKLPAGNRVGVVTMSGGAGVLLADRCVEAGLSLPKLADDTRTKLKEVMVPYASPDNPVDATAGGYNDNFTAYRKAVGLVLNDPNVDAAMARCPRGKGAMQWSESLIEMLRGVEKPFLLNWGTAPDDNADVLAYLEENGVPCIMAPGRTVHALAMLHEFAQKRRAWQQRKARTASRIVAKQALDLPNGSGALGEHRSKSLLRSYGIPAVEERLLASDAIEKLTQAPLPFPLAVKIESADIPHKTEAGVVRLNIASLDALKQAAREILASAKKHKADARIDGILVQQMASGVEVIVGAVNDPYFGPVVTFGLGGIFTELLKDVTHRFAPFDVETAKEMISEIKAAPLLNGYRGKPACDVAALADTLARVSLFVADHIDRIAELDINPLFVRTAGQGVVAADALLVLKP